MGKKYIEILSQKTKRAIDCQDIKKIYFRVAKKRPILPAF